MSSQSSDILFMVQTSSCTIKYNSPALTISTTPNIPKFHLKICNSKAIDCSPLLVAIAWSLFVCSCLDVCLECGRPMGGMIKHLTEVYTCAAHTLSFIFEYLGQPQSKHTCPFHGCHLSSSSHVCHQTDKSQIKLYSLGILEIYVEINF